MWESWCPVNDTLLWQTWFKEMMLMGIVADGEPALERCRHLGTYVRLGL